MFNESEIEEILELAQQGEGKDRGAVIESAGQVKGVGEPCSILLSGDGRIRVAARRSRVTLDRRYGLQGSIRVTWKEIAALLPVLRHWERHREEWAAFHYSSSGYPAPFGYAWYYIAPGKCEKCEGLGLKVGSTSGGRRFTGRDEQVRLSKPRLAAPGIRVLGENWHVGEKAVKVPAERMLVGEVYEVTSALVFDAERLCGLLRRPNGRRRSKGERGERFAIEDHEVRFMERLWKWHTTHRK